MFSEAEATKPEISKLEHENILLNLTEVKKNE
jgi:hypothetical protein